MANPAGEDEDPEVRLASRGGDFVFAVLVRPLMLLLWSFVFWGTFWCSLFAWRGITAGWPAAVQSATPRAGDAGWAYLDLASALLALAVWGVLAWASWARRR